MIRNKNLLNCLDKLTNIALLQSMVYFLAGAPASEVYRAEIEKRGWTTLMVYGPTERKVFF